MRRLALAAVLAVLALPVAAMDKPYGWVQPRLEEIPNFRARYRDVIIELATYAKRRNPKFVVLMRGGVELVVKGDLEEQWDEIHDPGGRNFEKRQRLGTTFRPLLKVLDGLVLDGLYCGPDAFGKPIEQVIKERRELDDKLASERREGIQRPPPPLPTGPFSLVPREELKKAEEVKKALARVERQRRATYAIAVMRDEDRQLWSVEDCTAGGDMAKAYGAAAKDKVVAFAATGDADMDRIPQARPNAENPATADSPTKVRNWLPLLAGERWGSRAEFVNAVAATNYDAVVLDVTWRGDPLTKADLYAMRFKKLGSPRLVLADLPIGKAYDTRWYWQKGWGAGNPRFLYAVDPDRQGAYIVDIGDDEWKKILGTYITGIMDAGFDGVVLDDAATYLWYEELMPLD
jgi:endo-alpha-1,4-polygalactosaminidase (GH114 family)